MSHRRLLLGMLVAVAAVCGAAVWIASPSATAPPEEAPAETVPPAPRPDAGAPSVPDAPGGKGKDFDVEAARRALASDDRALVLETLRQLLDPPEEGRALLAELEAIAGRDDARLALEAKLAIMRIEGSRRFLWDTITAGRSDVAKAKDPRWGAVLEAAWRGNRGRISRVPGFDALVRAIEADGEDPLAVLLRALAGAGGEGLQSWLRIAGALRPLPKELGPVLAAKLKSADLPDAKEIERWIQEATAELAPIAEALLGAALHRLEEKDPAEFSHLLPAIAALGIGDERVTGPLLALVRDPESSRSGGSREALRALERLGRRATGAAPELTRAFETAPEGLREQILRTLGALGDPSAVPLFATVVRSRAAGIEGQVAALAAALVACDPKLETPLAPPLMCELLDHERPDVRARAVEASLDLARLPDAVADALLAAGRDDDPEVARSVKRTLGGMATHRGLDARLFLPVLLPLAETRATDSATASRRALAVRALARIESPPDEVLVAFRGAADSDHETVRRAAREALAQRGPK